MRVELGKKRVRAYIGGVLIADTVRPLLVWEVPYYPTYYFPVDHISPGVLQPSATIEKPPSRGVAAYFDLQVKDHIVHDAAYAYPESPIEELVGYVAFVWSKIDQWFEEDEEIHVHARDPYTRVDVLPSSRHVRVAIAGQTVADSHHPRMLFETGLPTRFYLPKTDVRMDLLVRSDLTTECPYKGTAEYWSATVDGVVFENIAWGYRHPVRESERIAGLISFYNEKVDVSIDGAEENRPVSKFA